MNYLCINPIRIFFIIFSPKHMLWVLKSTDSMEGGLFNNQSDFDLHMPFSWFCNEAVYIKSHCHLQDMHEINKT